MASGIVSDGYTTITISQCYNTGDISVEATSYSKQYSGYASGISYDCTMLDCYNTGKVEAVKALRLPVIHLLSVGGTPSDAIMLERSPPKTLIMQYPQARAQIAIILMVQVMAQQAPLL